MEIDTDHDHLGKLITYASDQSADFVIWVVRKARPEHCSAIERLNNYTDDTCLTAQDKYKAYLDYTRVGASGNSSSGRKCDFRN